jgi:spore coat protein A
MRFRVTRREPDDATIPERLSTMVLPDADQVRAERTFVFQNHDRRSWTINGREFDPTRPVAAPRIGATEVWRFITDFHHSVHVHLSQFLVLSRNGKPPGPGDGGWKDTIDLRPAEEATVILRFADYPGRYVMHCHNLEHEDMAMMATIEVTPT